jgi:hypothetical protein
MFTGSDRVAIVVDAELPSAGAVLGMLLEELAAADVAMAQLDIVVTPECMSLQTDCAAAAALWGPTLQWQVHEPTADDQMAYLAATKDGRPLYLHRSICEADVVLPLALARAAVGPTGSGLAEAWFPTFSNVATQARHAAAGNVQWETHRRRRREEAAEAAWLLGLNVQLQVLPASGGGVAGVLCGELNALEQATSEWMQQHWSLSQGNEFDAAVLVLDAPLAGQSWRNVARLTQLGRRLVRAGGTIVLATQLSREPGPALATLDGLGHSEDEAMLALLRMHSGDAAAALALRETLPGQRLFLKSRLDDSVVEQLGVGAWHTVEELERIVRGAATCVVIQGAQHAALDIPLFDEAKA